MKKQTELEDAIKKTEQQAAKNSKQQTYENKIERPKLWSACCPYRNDVPYVDHEPSLTRQEFAAECEINNIMKNYEATGIIPTSYREPIYWDADQVPANLQEAMSAMMYANDLFMQLGAPIRREFEDDAVKFVEFASNPDNKAKLKEWGLTAPEKLPDAPIRVEVVAPPTPPPGPSGDLPPGKQG